MARVIAAGAEPAARSRVLVVAAVLFAAVAAALVFVALQQRTEEGQGSVGAVTDVVVAARDLPANTRLTADMLEVRAVPAQAALTDGYASIEALVGLPTRYPLARGEQLTRLKVGVDAIQDKDDLALVLPTGKRGFAVEVTEITGVGGLLLPGNTVDVIAVFDEGAAGIDKAVMLLQNIQVLSVGQEAQEPVPAAAGASEGAVVGEEVRARRPEDVERQPEARTVTLAVTPAEAQLLALAQENGRLWLALRPFDDSEILPLGEQILPPLLAPTPAEFQQE